MRPSQVFYILAAIAGASASPAKRQGLVILESPGSITSPADDSSFVAGDSFPLGIAVPEWSHCHPGYTQVSIYLLATQPTTSSLNSTQGFSNYLDYFGEYLVNNFPGELPSMGTPPPSSLTMPDLGSSITDGTEVYLATIEVIGGCPPNGFTEWAIDSVGISYST